MEVTHYVSIKFSPTGKGYYFGTDMPDLKVGDKIVAESIRGLQVGEVSGEIQPISKYKSELELKPIIRRATEDDLLIYDENIKRAKQAMKISMIEINKLELDMRPIDAEYALDGSKLTIAYTAEDRVDFRELLKVLASRFHCRIELRQVGSRDKAKMVGGIGICGLPLCCSHFLSNIEGISINRAKNQMLSLNIPKLSGHCGKLICCLLFEDDTYTELKKDFPPIGSMFEKDGEAFKLSSINVISKVVKLENPNEVRFLPLADLKEYKKAQKRNEKSEL
ncbi:MAG: regulatory iron-sulfur-containing complex subunit RicT [Bacilli bacterium]|nr:regulatory iron-sulfur-containing complex subunit RicT [Bacilli bacterium]